MQIQNGNIKLKHMSRRTVVRHGNKAFKQEIFELKESLGRVKFVATTANMWSFRNRRILGSTVNWVN